MESQKISITTFNILGLPILPINTYYRLHKTATILNSLDTDIINLQEVFTYRHLEILKKKMVNFRYCVYEKFIFGPKGGLVTFSKLPIKRHKYVSFSLYSAFLEKLFLSKGILISKISNISAFIVNTHLTTNKDNDWSSGGRSYIIHKTQIVNLYKPINLIKNYKFMVISGDFNIAKKSALYNELVATLDSRDLFKKYNSPTFHEEFMSEGQNSNRIDYLFVRMKKKNKFKVIKTEHLFEKKMVKINVNKGFLSDHIGLKATVIFN